MTFSLFSFTLIKNKGKAEVMELINSVLGSLVSITGNCNSLIYFCHGYRADDSPDGNQSALPMDTRKTRGGKST